MPVDLTSEQARPGDSASTEKTPVALTAAQRELLLHEADDFYKAELGHDQRASWLLALCSALAIGLAGFLLSMAKGGAPAGWVPIVVWVAFALVALATAVTLVSLWPLRGRHARFWLPGRRHTRAASGASAHAPVPTGDDAWYVDHYRAHRCRAERKVGLLVFALIALLLALISVCIGLAGYVLVMGPGAAPGTP